MKRSPLKRKTPLRRKPAKPRRKPLRRKFTASDPRIMFGMDRVQYSETGKAYVITATGRRRYGEVSACIECGTEYLKVNVKVAQGYCSRSCSKLGVPSPRVMTAKGQRAACDIMASIACRSREKCERCGETDYEILQCAHIISRRYFATRWDFDNLLCLCRRCHVWGHSDPLGWDEFIVELKGQEFYDDLKRRARRPMSIGQKGIDYAVIRGRLEQLIEETCGLHIDDTRIVGNTMLVKGIRWAEYHRLISGEVG